MIIQEIEEYFEKKNLDGLLTKYGECFERLDHFTNAFKTGSIDNSLMTDMTLKELGAIFSSLNIVAQLSEYYFELAEATEITNLRIHLESNKEKVVASLLEKQAELTVTDYKRICVIFQTFRDNCDKLISICQSSLKSGDQERKAHGFGKQF